VSRPPGPDSGAGGTLLALADPGLSLRIASTRTPETQRKATSTLGERERLPPPASGSQAEASPVAPA
jgi:hypothetical protein